MDTIKRDLYLQRLIDRRNNGLIKIITGIRRCGKSFLLFNLYYDYLLSNGVNEEQIIKISLDDDENEDLLQAKELGSYIRSRVSETQPYYIFLDEIQMVTGFEKVLNGLNKMTNLDIYVTGSNSRFLSTDILTEFRGRGDEVRIYPLSFSEFFLAHTANVENAWDEYITYGGLPLILSMKTKEQKSSYLTNLFETVYISDIVQRNNLRKDFVLEAIVDILASSIGSLTSPLSLANTFKSQRVGNISDKTISTYINCLTDAFMINKAKRYDIKGKRYIYSPAKYYFTDVGLRNGRLNFRQQEENHLMENIIYNELRIRGYNVDVGVVEQHTVSDNCKIRKNYEIDFVCNQFNQRYYLQSAWAIPDREKMLQEQRPLVLVNDSFKKIIIVKDNRRLWITENGIAIIGLMEFLLNPNSLNL